MSKEMQDERTLELLAAIENYIEMEEEESEEDAGLWETLSVDMLSAAETKRLADLLQGNEGSLRLCELLHHSSVYETTPFYDRMREYEKNPEAETDENWKKIAFAFRPELKAVKRGGAPRSAFLATDGCWDEPIVAAASGPRMKKLPNWLAYSAALLLCGAAVGLVWDGQDASQLPTTSEEAEGEYALGAKGLGAPPSEKETREPQSAASGGILEPDWRVEEERVLRANAMQIGREPIVSDAKSYDGLEALETAPFDIGDWDAFVYLSGHGFETNADLDDEEARTATERWALIAEKLSEAEPVDEEALAVARWNLAVASIKSGDLASGRVILNELEEMKLNAAMNARVGAAIRFLEEKFLEDDAPLE